MTRTLILGGTTEASSLARALADRGDDALFSYAGRTAAPVAQPLPTRVGGFGGVAGLLAFIAQNNITRVIDATHPFAAQMSRNAHAASTQAGIPLAAFERAPWAETAADNWTHLPSIEAAAASLPQVPTRVFLAIGKQALSVFANHPQHHYLLRLVDQPDAPLPLPHTTVTLARGPFDVAGDIALLRDHGTKLIIAKNAGGTGAEAKLIAARELGLRVLMIQRPAVPPRTTFARLDDILAWLDHTTDRGV
jgi:precorrin-6A/cobalt-precorrin-6A reductase